MSYTDLILRELEETLRKINNLKAEICSVTKQIDTNKYAIKGYSTIIKQKYKQTSQKTR
nr:hypothetical protein [Candidatus Enterousia merdequi]